MKRYPKYIALPVALLIYFVAMAAYSIWHNHGHLPEHFGLIVAVELAVLAALYFLLKKKGA